MTKTPPDDLEAVRILVETLQNFDGKDQERIIRWAREKIGLAPSMPQQSATTPPVEAANLEAQSGPTVVSSKGGGQDIKSFVNEKNPVSDNQFAAVVAYYYQFEAPQEEKKEAINSEDLQDACRKASRTRLASPLNTLNNAHKGGLLDRAGERGAFKINSVGENLVAMTLPGEVTAKNTGRRLRKGEIKQRKSPKTKLKSSKPKSRAQ